MSSGPKEGPFQGGGDRPLKAGSFEIIEEIGRGGMGVVFRAYDSKLDREVALKRPHLDLLGRSGFRSRFIDEARASSKLSHPNITTVFEVFEENAVPWIVMELVDGATLRSLLAGRHPLSFENVLRYAEGLTDALRVAHLAGTLHCDINPNNILVGKDNRARLSDFGLARARDEPREAKQSSTQTTETAPRGIAVGTRGYMSPEQALGKSLDLRSDLFSLGLVIYEMCTGLSAFIRPGTDDWLDELLHRDPQPISELNAEIPLEFKEIIHKAISKRRFQRHQSARELLIDIQAVRRRFQSDSGSSPPGDGARSMGRRKWSAIAKVGALVAAVSVTAAVIYINREPAQPVNWESRQLTSAPGWESEPAFSPSGAFIAYSSNESGNRDIWLLDVNAGNSLQLTFDSAEDGDPAWCWNDTSIAYVSNRSGTKSIWRIPRLGGKPVLMLDDAEDPACSPDGFSLAFSRADAAGSLRIHTAPLEDLSRVTRLTGDDDGLWNHRDPAWSPDGKMICFADFRNLRLVPVTGGPSRPLTSEQAIDMEPAWSPSGKRIFFSSMRGGAYALWSIAVRSGSPERLTPGTGPERNPTLSEDGHFIGYSTFGRERDVAVLDRKNRRRFWLRTSRYESAPNLSPDGSTVVFVSDMRGKFDLWTQRLTEGEPVGVPERLTHQTGSVALPTFSPDGKWIAYLRVVDGQRDIWLVPAEGGVPIQFTDHPATDIHPAFSPAGDRIAFVSDRGGTDQLWIGHVDAGQSNEDPVQVTKGEVAVRMPAWSPDGSKIAFIRDNDVWITLADSGAEPARLTENADAEVIRWDVASGDLIVSGVWQTDRKELRRVSPSDGNAHLFDPPVVFGETGAFGLFGMSRDGRYVTYLATQSSGDLWMMEAR